MKIKINTYLELVLFNKSFDRTFFESIHERLDISDEYRSRLQEKYKTQNKVTARINDAVENKYKVDGTPDFFIFYKSKLVGVFEFAPLQKEEEFVEVGYWLYKEYRRKGILSSIFPKMITFAKEHFDRPRLIATTPIDNVPSQKLLEKCGFYKTGKIEEFTKDNGTKEVDMEHEIKL